MALAHAGLARHHQQAGAGLEAARARRTNSAERPARRGADGPLATLCSNRQPQLVELRHVATHLLDEHLEQAPARHPGRRERVRDRGVAAAGGLGHDPQAGPAGPVVEVVEGVDEVAVGAGRELGPGQSGHVTSTPCSRLRLRMRAAGWGCPQ